MSDRSTAFHMHPGCPQSNATSNQTAIAGAVTAVAGTRAIKQQPSDLTRQSDSRHSPVYIHHRCRRRHQTAVRHCCLIIIITAANIALTHTVDLLIVAPPSTCVCFLFVCLLPDRVARLQRRGRGEGEGRAG